MMWLLLFIIIGLPLCVFIIGAAFSAPGYKGPVSDHFNGKQFINPGGVKAKGTGEVLKWMMQRKRTPWIEDKNESYGKRPLDHFNDGIRITFVNHTTFLIQVAGVNILTDPVWSKRVSPFRLIGPKRMRSPGIRFEDLPRIHVVLLSHNHYDHLDVATMRMVFGGHHPMIITPLGVKGILDQERIAGTIETDWWDEVAIKNEIKVQAVPAQHFSGRGMLDRDATLWCGYVISTSFGNIYFAGDTGYNDQTFKKIGERCGKIKISILPIGAYRPGWFMSPVHTSPAEAAKIHQDVQSTVSIGSHFGTFPLADEGKDDPISDLKIALKESNISEEDFITMQEGEARVFE